MAVQWIGLRDHLALSVDELLTLKHRELSDDPVDPRELRSRHFLLRTDISDRQAAILLDKLETMFDLVAEYFGQQPGSLIECYVVDDISKWNTSDWEQGAVQKVRQGEGRTYYARRGSQRWCAVYSSSNHDVVQHEAVHGFCYLTFDDTGPLWYAEGLAEMGQYWKADDLSVAASPAVIGYLRSRPPQTLRTIVEATQIEGDLWKAYSWRWSLCHFLATNPNYARQFKSLGRALMRNSSSASFANTWRNQANELTFEYEFFLEHLEAGLRMDLCWWDWSVEPRKPSTGRTLQARVLAARGWQPSGALMEDGVTYRVICEGEWQLAATGEPVDADGDPDGNGTMIGVILRDFELSDEFELGTNMEFTAPAGGHLFVRCRERMSQVADNVGEIKLSMRRKQD